MIIEELDSLKVWLVKKLEPICDADPTALAKYVIALAKKDKPEPDLRALCEDQLDVFLGDETKNFVTQLFHTLESKSYFPSLATNKDGIERELLQSEQKGIKRKSFEEGEQTEVEKVLKTDETTDVGKVKSDLDKENVKTNIILSDKKDIPIENRRNSAESSISMIDSEKTNMRIPEKDRQLKVIRNEDFIMRSVSQDRSLKSMSPPGRPSRRGHSRRKSPRSPSRPSNRQHSSRSSRRKESRREHRDGSRERRSRRRTRREKCRDYEEKGFCMLGEACSYDHGYDPVEVDDRTLPQMLTLAGLPVSHTTNQSLPGQPSLQIMHGGIIPARSLIASMNSGIPINPTLSAVQLQQRPILSPAELSQGQVPIFRPRNPVAFMRNISPPITPISSVPTVSAVSSVETTQSFVATPTSTTGEPYNPEQPSIEKDESDTIPKENGDINNGQFKDLNMEDSRSQDELVRIAMGNVPLTPIVGSQSSNMFDTDLAVQQIPQPVPTMQSQGYGFYQQQPLLQQTYLPMTMNHNFQQFQLQQQQFQQQQINAQVIASQSMLQQQQPTVVSVQTAKAPYRKNTVLEIRKIPKDLNNIVKLSEHFQKFGTITKLQTPFDNDHQAALIEFATYQQATEAYNAPEAILGNRFIKMFWHNPNRNQKSGNSNHQNTTNTTTTTVASGGGAVTKVHPTENVDAKSKKVATSEELKYVNPKSDPRLMQLEKQKELEQLKMELLKKKQTHYDELVKKQKDVLAKLQDKSLTKEEKARLLKAFKHCDVAAQKLKKELEDNAKAKSQPQLHSVHFQQFKDHKKEILDKEMDIFHGNLEGEELVEATRALEQLKREAYSSRGRGGYRGRTPRGSWYRGRGRGRGRGRSGAHQTNSLDNRPKQILVTGFDVDEKDDVLTHFAAFGPLDRIEEIATDRMALTFPTRKAAEIAAIQGVDFNDKQLVLTWFKDEMKTSKINESQTIQRRMTRSLSQSLMEKDMDDELLELDKDEEELLLAGVDDEDEDEDIESDERSWRR